MALGTVQVSSRWFKQNKRPAMVEASLQVASYVITDENGKLTDERSISIGIWQPSEEAFGHQARMMMTLTPEQAAALGEQLIRLSKIGVSHG